MNETLDDPDRELDLALRDAFAGECRDVAATLAHTRDDAREVPLRTRCRPWLAAALILLGVAVVALAVLAERGGTARTPLQDPVRESKFDLRPTSLAQLRDLLLDAESATLIPRVALARVGPGKGPNGLYPVESLAESFGTKIAGEWASAFAAGEGADLGSRSPNPAAFTSPGGEVVYRAELRFATETGFVAGYLAATETQLGFAVEGAGMLTVDATTCDLSDRLARLAAEAARTCRVASAAEHLVSLPPDLCALFWFGEDPEVLAAHLPMFKQLRHLDVYGAVDTALVAMVGGVASLEALWLRGDASSMREEVDLGELSGCNRLRRLSLAHATCDLLPLTALSALREVAVYECKLRGPVGSVLATLPLERLVLSEVAPLGREIDGLSRSRSIVDAALYASDDPGTALACLRELAKLPSLRHLSLAAKGLDVVEIIEGMDQLRVLDLPGHPESLAQAIRKRRPDLNVATRQ